MSESIYAMDNDVLLSFLLYISSLSFTMNNDELLYSQCRTREFGGPVQKKGPITI